MEELRKEIGKVFILSAMDVDRDIALDERGKGETCIPDYQIWALNYADQILTLIREAGWKSPDRIPNATICPKCNEMHWIK